MRIIKFSLLLLFSFSSAQWLETTIVLRKKPGALCYNSRNHRVYTDHYYSHCISVIDAHTNEVIDSIPIMYYPGGICYNSVNNKLYASSMQYGRRTYLWVIDGATNQIIKVLRKGDGCGDWLYVEENNKVYWANHEANNITVVSGDRDSVVATIPAGSYPNGFCYNSKNRKLYCSNYGSDDVTVIDGERDSVLKTIRVGDGPWYMVYNPRENKIYVVNWLGTNVSVIDGDLDSVIATVEIGDYLGEICYNPLENKIYCAYFDGVAVIDGATNRVITRIPAGLEPYSLIYNPINNKIYCANFSSDDVTVIDGRRNLVITTIRVGHRPGAFVHNPIENRVYVSNIYYQQNHPPESTISVIRDVIGLDEVSRKERLPIGFLPNPANEYLTISLKEPIGQLVLGIYNSIGDLVRRERFDGASGKLKFSLKGLRSGVYIIKGKGRGKEFTEKLVIR